MRPRLNQWRTWLAQNGSWPFRRLAEPQVESLRFGYEKAGLCVTGEPIPWNAETVLVEAILRFPPEAYWRKSDFQLLLPGSHPVLAVGLEPCESEGAFRVLFRLPPLPAATEAILHCQGRVLGRVSLPFLAAETFLGQLRLHCPQVFACLGRHTVACRATVASQCRGLVACAVLTSPTSLLPLADFEVVAEFADEAGDFTQAVLVRLTSSELRTPQAFLSALPAQWPRTLGRSVVRWKVRDQLLASSEIRGISPMALEQSLYLVDAYYLYETDDGTVVCSHHLPPRDELRRLRPCFLVASREPGMAALCPLQVRVQFRDPERPPLVLDQEVLVTDGPSRCLPELPGVADCREVRAFELVSQGTVLGILRVSRTPAASFTGEGGFFPSEDYDWTAHTEEELVDRIQKLMLVGQEGEGPEFP